MVYAHFEPKQANAMRQLNSRHIMLAHSKLSPAKTLTRTFSSTAWELALKFGKRTTIHGLNRLLNESAGKYEKLVWLFTLVFAFIGSIYVCLIVSQRFNDGRFETIVDSTNEPVYRIHFPVVTICNQNRLNWQRLAEAKQRFLPTEKSQDKLQLFERVMGAYDSLEFSKFDHFYVLQNDSLAQMNHVNFSEVFEFMTWRCEELLTNCMWNHYAMNCCDIFSRRKTKSGYCWAFNTLESDEGRRMKLIDPLWPWHTANAGPATGLMVRVLINSDKHYDKRKNEKGISVMITEPNVWHKDPFVIAEKTQTILEIEPVIYFYDNGTRRVSSKQRQCVFDDEQNSEDFKSLQGFVYMIENCQSECHQEYLMRYCNCTMDLMFPPGPYPACKATDLLCLARNNEHFLYSHQPGEEQYVRNHHTGMVCKCFRNCYSLNYVGDVRPTYLPADAVSGNKSYVDLDVHYRFDAMMMYRTRLVFGWVDLLVAFGGIAGLFLGCSLISAMELAYFGLIELPNFAYSELKLNWQRRSLLQQRQQQQQQQTHPARADGTKQSRKFYAQNRIISQHQPPDYSYNSKLYANNNIRVAAWNQLNTTNSMKANYTNRF